MAKFTLCPYCVPRPPLTTMSVCGSNRLVTFSVAGTVSPCSTRRRDWSATRHSRSLYRLAFSVHDGAHAAPDAATAGSARSA